MKYDVLAVTDVKVFPIKILRDASKLRAMVEVVLNEQLILRGLRVMEGENGLCVAYPIDPFYKGEEYRTMIQPITKGLKEHIENCVLEAYQKEIIK